MTDESILKNKNGRRVSGHYDLWSQSFKELFQGHPSKSNARCAAASNGGVYERRVRA